MKLNNNTYDILKFICLRVLPALATLIIAIGSIWNIPYYEAIAATVTALNAFLGALIGISAQNYTKAIEEARSASEEELKADLCDNYCIYPHRRLDADVMQDICDDCPLNYLTKGE